MSSRSGESGLIGRDETLTNNEDKSLGELMQRKHCFKNGNRIFHVSIIDFLQEWNTSKKLERFSKTVVLGRDGE